MYAQMEVATHGYRHEPLGKVNDSMMQRSVNQDKEILERLTGKQILGHAYAHGSTSPAVEQHLKAQGYLYARAVLPSGSFEYPENPLNFRPSSSVIMGNTMKLVKKFLEAEADDRDLLLYLWGHYYEMDYGKGAASWDALKGYLQQLQDARILYTGTNSEAFLRI